MSIKLNGTTIFDESNFADKDLSNLSESGTQVINNAVSSAMSGLDYMKHINTKAGSKYVSTGSYAASFTSNSNGWVLLVNLGNQNGTFTIDALSISVPQYSTLSMPICSGTFVSTPIGVNAYEIVFFPEIS